MLHIENNEIREHILDGEFGLEKEGLRVLGNGKFAHTPHPFTGDAHIVRDFSENQTEINTSIHSTVEEAINELEFHNRRICDRLWNLPEKEYLWPFSNPPYIENEQDIPVAIFEGSQEAKTVYREYLSDKYGRYKMTFSGIHVNFSFSEELLRKDFELQQEKDFTEYKNHLYLELAKKMVMYGWLLVAVTAASPIMDSSFVEKGVFDKDIFTGMASVRCSEMGYWNDFAPVLQYQNIDAYVKSIQYYVDTGILRAPSELYYPIRLKPKGENNLETLRKNGVNHIELRMFDLNPLAEVGVDARDIHFAHLMIIWLASAPDITFTQKDQVQAIQNYKNAAHYDLKTVKIWLPGEENTSVANAALIVIDKMKEFYQNLGIPVQEILEFEYEKFIDAGNRYAWIIREQFKDGFVKKAMKFVKERQEK